MPRFDKNNEAYQGSCSVLCEAALRLASIRSIDPDDGAGDRMRRDRLRVVNIIAEGKHEHNDPPIRFSLYRIKQDGNGTSRSDYAASARGRTASYVFERRLVPPVRTNGYSLIQRGMSSESGSEPKSGCKK